jgi:NADH-quinone oxidoreductase subunit H
VLLGALIKTVFVLSLVVGVLAPLVSWVERKQGALIQNRSGPDRTELAWVTGHGLFQPLADLLKLLTKEDRVPVGANRILFRLMPAATAVAAMVAFAVIPFGGRYRIGSATLHLVVADVDWGVLTVLAVNAIAAIAVVTAGWSSNSHWSLLGAVRGIAHLISVQVTLGLTLLPMFMIYGSLKLTDMGSAQDATLRLGEGMARLGLAPLPEGLQWLSSLGLPAWGIFLQPFAFVMFLTCITAANRRPPFDHADSGSELARGALSGYSGMRYGLFPIAQTIEVATIAGLTTAIFLGGWSIPFVSQASFIAAVEPFYGSSVAAALCLVAHVATFFVKVLAVIALQISLRWSLPRIRHDQLMQLCWKVVLPLSLLNGFATAFCLLALGAG